MPKAVVKASSKSAKTQPKFRTNEVKVKGRDVILTGEVAAEVQNWLKTKSQGGPVPNGVTLASVLDGLTGATLRNQVKAEVLLPRDLLAWAEDEAWNLEGELSDIVRELLQFERYRSERLCTYARYGLREKGGGK